ncbi:MAG TPA: outer membrane beta-barrel protein [Candidatus Aminicenantes bacterium]|nr:outer membrane beta-barrel protein [Candidatus Aminicenantes bacterium]
MIIKRLTKPAVALTLAAVLLSFPAAGFAQERKHDLSFQFGLVSVDQFADILKDVIVIVITLGNFNKADQKFSAVPFLTYHYSANSRFGFGAAVGRYSSSGNLSQSGSVVGDFSEKNTIVAAELDYHWVMRPGFQLYSGAGFGVRAHRGRYTDGVDTDTVNKLLPTFNLNALGLRFGKKVGFFAEAGVGYKGLLSAGVNAQF